METSNARVDAVRGHHGGGVAPRSSGDNRGRDAVEVPAPKEGGTFFFCTEQMFSKQDKGRIVAGECHEASNTPKHFRTAAGYRRHWRLFHG